MKLKYILVLGILYNSTSGILYNSTSHARDEQRPEGVYCYNQVCNYQCPECSNQRQHSGPKCTCPNSKNIIPTNQNAISCTADNDTVTCPNATNCQALYGGTVNCPKATKCQAYYGSTANCPNATNCQAYYDGSTANCPKATNCFGMYSGKANCAQGASCYANYGGSCNKG